MSAAARPGRRPARLALPMWRLGFLRGFVPLVALLVIWQVFGDPASAFYPPPSAWYEDLRDLHGFGILDELLTTLRTFVVGLGIATVIGGALGIAIGTFRPVRRALASLLEFLRALPPPTVVPVAVLVLGQGSASRIFAVCFAGVWPVLLNTAAAAERTDMVQIDAARTLGLGRTAQMRKVVIPAAVPAVMLGVRVALPIALVVTILAEMLSADVGIGGELITAQRAYRSAEAFGLLFVVGLFGYLLNAAFTAIETRVLSRWPPQTT